MTLDLTDYLMQQVQQRGPIATDDAGVVDRTATWVVITKSVKDCTFVCRLPEDEFTKTKADVILEVGAETDEIGTEGTHCLMLSRCH